MGASNKPFKPICTMNEAIELVKQLQEENRRIRQGAHDWKMRARAAEKRQKELVIEKVKMQDEHRAALETVAKMLGETERKLCKVQADLLTARDDYEDQHWELAEKDLEIMRLKAEIYDLEHRQEEERCEKAS